MSATSRNAKSISSSPATAPPGSWRKSKRPKRAFLPPSRDSRKPSAQHTPSKSCSTCPMSPPTASLAPTPSPSLPAHSSPNSYSFFARFPAIFGKQTGQNGRQNRWKTKRLAQGRAHGRAPYAVQGAVRMLSSSRKGITPTCRMPSLSAKGASWPPVTMIFRKKSPLLRRGNSSRLRFSSVSIRRAHWM